MSGPPETQPRGHQLDELPRGKIMGLIVLALFIAGGLSVGAWGMQRAEQSSIRPLQRFPEQSFRGAAKIAAVHQRIFALGSEGQTLQAAQRSLLERWSWADKPRGLVYMPIDEAMRMLVAQSQPRPR